MPQAKLNEEVYIAQPEIWNDGTDRVWKLNVSQTWVQNCQVSSIGLPHNAQGRYRDSYSSLCG